MPDTVPLQDDCPVAPPALTTVYTRTLHRACEVAGGVAELAAQLRVPAIALQRWLDGEEIPPTRVFLQCVDIISLAVFQRPQET